MGTRRAHNSETSVGHRINPTTVVASTTMLQKLEVTPKAKDDRDLIVSELWGVSTVSTQTTLKTYYFRSESSIICMVHDGVIEVVGVTLVLVLKFVEKVEKLEGEGSRGMEYRCREPACTEELNLMRGHIDVTMTVLYDNAMDAVQVEDHVVMKKRWVGTRFTWTMAKLDYLTEGGEGHRLKEQTIPLLV